MTAMRRERSPSSQCSTSSSLVSSPAHHVARGQSRGNQYSHRWSESTAHTSSSSSAAVAARWGMNTSIVESSLKCQAPSRQRSQELRGLGPEEELGGLVAPQPAVLVVLLVERRLPARGHVAEKRMHLDVEPGLRLPRLAQIGELADRLQPLDLEAGFLA